MGEICRARDPRLGRDVAIKVLTAGFSQDPSAIDRFRLEARAASALNHPHICTIYDIGAITEPGDRHGQQFLVMELLEGQTLKEAIESGPLKADLTIDLGTQIADALDAAHAKGIVHRDIKRPTSS